MQTTQPNIKKRRLSPDDVRKVVPALEAYTQERLYGDVWKRSGLTPRDRSLVTIAALIARDQAPALTFYFNQALENGIKPREISEIITTSRSTQAGSTRWAPSARREITRARARRARDGLHRHR
jgi:alkylhydroperoxidase/carboxymuconolactone decarboxylase family protein YurZ